MHPDSVSLALEALDGVDLDELEERIERARAELTRLERVRACLLAAGDRTPEPVGVFASAVIRARQLEQEHQTLREVLTPGEARAVEHRIVGQGRRAGKSEHVRQQLADFLTEHGPTRAAEACDRLGISRGSAAWLLWDDPAKRFIRDERGRVTLAKRPSLPPEPAQVAG